MALANCDPEADIFREGMEIEFEYTQALYNQLTSYLEVTPRAEIAEKIGEVISDQLLSIATTVVAGKAVTLISDAALAAKLQQAIIIKNKADKTKPSKISWLNKFGAPGKDVARTLGLVVAEEYELVELNGLVVSFKNNPANNQALFNHAEEYLKHNQSGKKSKRVSGAVKSAPNEIKPARIMRSQITPQEKRLLITQVIKEHGFKKTNYYSNGQQVLQKGNKFIAIDIDSHNGGIWKMANSVKKLEYRTTRLGTYDQKLNRIGD
ncbi:MAG TPA: toxin C-terminal domain-containing protein [Candidatus Babeliales bacterium]|nr:toxin C-terminal domain-containing protein [Candidatus Babeliales bacterium]